MTTQNAYTVSQVASYLKDLLEADPSLSDLWAGDDAYDHKHHDEHGDHDPHHDEHHPDHADHDPYDDEHYSGYEDHIPTDETVGDETIEDDDPSAQDNDDEPDDKPDADDGSVARGDLDDDVRF